MLRIDDASTNVVYNLYLRVLSYGERLTPSRILDTTLVTPLRTVRSVALRVLKRQHPLLSSESKEDSAMDQGHQAQDCKLHDQSLSPIARDRHGDDPGFSRQPMSKMFWCCSPGLEGAVLSLFALNFSPMGLFIQSAMEASIKDVSYFVTDTAAYIVSKMWDDMLASDIFKYSFMLVVVCAIIKAYVESFYARHNRGSLIIPGMLGMLVGWSFGRSFQGLRHMLEAYFLGCERWGPPTHVTTNDFDLSYIFSGQSKAESRAATNDCLECEVIAPSEMTTRFRMLYALLVTLCSSFIILLLEPAAALETFGSSSWRRTIGIEVKSLVQLLSKAAATTSMILWNDALTGGATKGIEDDQEDVRIRMLLFYSMAMTFGGSAVSIQFQSWSRHLTALAEEAARAAAEAASKKREVALRMDDQMRKLSETEGDAGGTAALAESSVQSFSEAQQPGEKVNCQPIGVDILPRSRSAASLSGLIKMGGDNAAGVARSLKAQTRRTRRLLETMGANITALRIRVHFIAASLRMLAVLEATLGWVTGCAWTDYTIAVYPTIGAFPSDWWILLDNVKIAILLSVLAIAWITFTGNSSVGASGERETRERLFIGGAFSFFSGWAWISVVRCIWVLPYALLPESGTAPFGVDGPVDWQYVIELLLSLVFCPIATWLVILAALSTKNAYEKRAGISLWKRHVNAIRAFTRARAEINRKLRMAPSRLPDVLL